MEGNQFEKHKGNNNGPSLLTLDLALSSPRLYKQKLIELFCEGTERGAAIWEKQNQLGIMDTNSLLLDTTTWVSHSTLRPDGKREVSLGVQPIPPKTLPYFMFNYENFSEDDTVVYRCVHELCHDVAFYALQKNSNFIRLYNLALSMRKSPQKIGLARLASWPFYEKRGKETQALEDVTELLNALAHGEKYLSDYFDYLANPNNQTSRKDQKLQSIDYPQVRQTLWQQIHDGMDMYLNRID